MRTFLHFLLRRGKVAFQTALFVPFLLALRFGVEQAGWQFVTPGPLLNALVTGGIFVVALVVAGTLTDYKESERVPAEMVASMSSIHTDAEQFKREKPQFDLEGLEHRLRAVVRTFRSDLSNPGARDCLSAINSITESFAEMDRAEVVATYISRLRAEQANIRKSVLRVYHIQKTEFVPSAYTLIWTVLFLAIGVLTFTITTGAKEAYVLLAGIYFFLIYLARLLKILDTPFQPRKHTADDVDLFLLDEFAASIGEPPMGNAAPTNGKPPRIKPTKVKPARVKRGVVPAVKWDARSFGDPPAPT